MGKFTLALACALLGATGTAIAASPPSTDANVKVEIVWDPATPAPEGRIWMTYLFTRAAFAAREPATSGARGESQPTFEEEVRARKMAVQTFRELRAANGAIASAYFSDVDRVEEAGFLREYVWRYLRRDDWDKVPLGLDLSGFDEWRQVELARHVPVTRGRIAFKMAAR